MVKKILIVFIPPTVLICLALGVRLWLAQQADRWLKQDLRQDWDLSVQYESIRLSWADFSRIEVKNIRVQTFDAALEPLIEAPHMTIFLNPRSLLKGKIRVEGIAFKEASCFLSPRRLNDFRTRYRGLSGEPQHPFTEGISCTGCSAGFRSGILKLTPVLGLENADFRILKAAGSETVMNLTFSGMLTGTEKDFFAAIFYDVNADQAELKMSSDQETLMFEGAVAALSNMPEIRGLVTVLGYPLQGQSVHDKVDLSGSLTGEFRISCSGRSLADWRSSLTVQGTMDVRDGIWSGRNLISESLEPALIEKAMLPQIFNETAAGLIFEKSRLGFERFFADFQILDQELLLNEFQVFGTGYAIQVQGSFDRQSREADLSGYTVLLERPAAEMVRRQSDLKSFMNAQGRLVVPFIYRGIEPFAEVKPDRDIAEVSLTRLQNS